MISDLERRTVNMRCDQAATALLRGAQLALERSSLVESDDEHL